MDAEAVKRSPEAAGDVVRFWFDETSPRKWFMGGPAFDAEVRNRFSGHHSAASLGLIDHWRATPDGALALVLILDQFSRNLFRKNPRAFASDADARRIAEGAIRRRFDRVCRPKARAFFYLPFMHSENLADQQRSLSLFTAGLAGSMNIAYAQGHAAIIRRFGRFPHRNAVLGRKSTPAELAFLNQGGFDS